jgi:hypothetical protein
MRAPGIGTGPARLPAVAGCFFAVLIRPPVQTFLNQIALLAVNNGQLHPPIQFGYNLPIAPSDALDTQLGVDHERTSS